MNDDPSIAAFLIRYLLGRLPENQQIEIEERAFEDPSLLQTIQNVENDLIDEYVRGGLSFRDRRQFELRFMASAERRRKVEFAKALAIVAEDANQE